MNKLGLIFLVLLGVAHLSTADSWKKWICTIDDASEEIEKNTLFTVEDECTTSLCACTSEDVFNDGSSCFTLPKTEDDPSENHVDACKDAQEKVDPYLFKVAKADCCPPKPKKGEGKEEDDKEEEDSADSSE